MKELEKYKKIVALLDMQKPAPTSEQIAETISILKARLEYKPINRHSNFAVKEGYQKAVEILESGEKNFNKVDVSELKTIQGRAIASIAVDYLNGLCSSETLCRIPIND